MQLLDHGQDTTGGGEEVDNDPSEPEAPVDNEPEEEYEHNFWQMAKDSFAMTTPDEKMSAFEKSLIAARVKELEKKHRGRVKKQNS